MLNRRFWCWKKFTKNFHQKRVRSSALPPIPTIDLATAEFYLYFWWIVETPSGIPVLSDFSIIIPVKLKNSGLKCQKWRKICPNPTFTFTLKLYPCIRSFLGCCCWLLYCSKSMRWWFNSIRAIDDHLRQGRWCCCWRRRWNLAKNFTNSINFTKTQSST